MTNIVRLFPAYAQHQKAEKAGKAIALPAFIAIKAG
jgi:hypothetical protein